MHVYSHHTTVICNYDCSATAYRLSLNLWLYVTRRPRNYRQSHAILWRQNKVLHIAFYGNGLKMSLHLSMVWLHAFHPVRVTIYDLSCAAPVTWIILRIGSANERRRYNVTSYFIGSAHTRNGPCAKYTRLPYHWLGLRASYHLTVLGHQTSKEIMI